MSVTSSQQMRRAIWSQIEVPEVVSICIQVALDTPTLPPLSAPRIGFRGFRKSSCSTTDSEATSPLSSFPSFGSDSTPSALCSSMAVNTEEEIEQFRSGFNADMKTPAVTFDDLPDGVPIFGQTGGGDDDETEEEVLTRRSRLPLMAVAQAVLAFMPSARPGLVAPLAPEWLPPKPGFFEVLVMPQGPPKANRHIRSTLRHHAEKKESL
eukprot:CAMPEP_0203903830 /NCGR_PEP_ID=MMETSP0359-20131031/45711_1 /ASSEMBLY_ACC=CAM_ASM_000338 /TAXON_ID=268821 /ORGANISM="Scrippsiella Hangoei, Strain SHTV-5" /LENGTH=208 /DNA_ID=CAMNT_0050827937 /DNA_START=52 /DNA_END=678 /DNA_ORIENTATION=+